MAVQRTGSKVSLTPELERFISAWVASGRYQTASEVVRSALRLLELTESLASEAPAFGPTPMTGAA